MCRITGIAFKSKHFDAIDYMTDSLQHGGPDDRGIWKDNAVALGHRRLAIHDLSPLGHQPMLSASQRFVTVFNGEIYNFQELRVELEIQGCNFKGYSDTEVLLAAVESWGVEEALQKFNGMFAFALWDRKDKKLYLARDRFGEKPLYYGICNGAFIFASELKALEKYSEFQADLNLNSIQLLLRYGYIEAPFSIYKGISKLEPAHYLCIDVNLNLKNVKYWSCENLILQAKANVYSGTFLDAVNELDHLLTESVAKRMSSDVPLGAFLSGGVDSSLVVALMQKITKNPVKTFSIGFHSDTYNEAPHALEVAKHLRTEHHELYVSEQDLLDVVPYLATLYDEPFADSSQIPTYLVSKMARKQVTVALSGDAADEVFGGYDRYAFFYKWKKLYDLPYSIKKLFSAGVRLYPQNNALKRKLHKLGNLLLQKTDHPYQVLMSQNYHAECLLREGQFFQKNHIHLNELTPIENLMLSDTIVYLPGDILTKVDRASMAVALETRIPFLDPELFNFAWSLPLDYKIQGKTGKRILKELLYRYVPRELTERPKAGFGVPIQDWLSGPLKEWGGDLLSLAALKQQALFNEAAIHQMWQDHLSKKKNFGYALWNILILQQWLNQK